MKALRSVCYASTLLIAGGLANTAMGADKPTYGWVETGILDSWGAEVKVKLDTGALTSSMQAEDIETFERDDEDWVRFTVEIEDENTDEVVSRTFERAIFRDLVVSGAGGKDHRPVVLMTLCMGQNRHEEQFSLEDRDDMNYPVLLGRRTIQSLGDVDVTQTFIQDPNCNNENSQLIQHSDHEYDEDIGI